MTAILLVSGWAPPMPSIWRTSGDPMAASKTRLRVATSAGRSLAWKYRPFEVPPRMTTHGMATWFMGYSSSAAEMYLRPLAASRSRIL